MIILTSESIKMTLARRRRIASRFDSDNHCE